MRRRRKIILSALLAVAVGLSVWFVVDWYSPPAQARRLLNELGPPDNGWFARMGRRLHLWSGAPFDPGRVADQLVRLGPPAVPTLIDALRDDDHWVKACSSEALGRIGDRRAVEPLAALVKSDTASTAAGLALCRLGDPRGVASANGLTTSYSTVNVHEGTGEIAVLNGGLIAPRDKNEPLELVLRMGPATVEPLVGAMIGDRQRQWPESEAAWRVLRIMLHRRYPEVDDSDFWSYPVQTPLVLTLAEHRRRREQMEAFRRGVSPEATEKLIALLRTGEWRDRARAALVAGYVADARVIPALVKLCRRKPDDPASLKDDDKEHLMLSAEAFRALGNLGEPAVPALMEMLKDPDEKLRANVFPALAMTGERKAMEELIRCAQSNLDEAPVLDVYAAVEAVGCFRELEVAEAMILLIREHRLFASETLEKIGDESTIQLLEKLLKDPDKSVRDTASKTIDAIRKKAPATMPRTDEP